MITLMAHRPKLLQLVTEIAHLVSHGHHRVHQSRHAGHVGTGNTLLVSPNAQRIGGKHRLGAA